VGHIADCERWCAVMAVARVLGFATNLLLGLLSRPLKHTRNHRPFPKTWTWLCVVLQVVVREQQEVGEVDLPVAVEVTVAGTLVHSFSKIRGHD